MVTGIVARILGNSERVKVFSSHKTVARIIVLVILGILVLVLAGCRPPWQSAPTAGGTAQQPATCPIDGTPTTTEAVTRRPLAVMIENSPSARPQSGLPEASVVYEAITEGGITRFMAVYLQGAPAVIGPVRSIRPHFLDIAREYDPAIVHCGQSYEALQILATTPGLYNLDQLKYAKPFWRDHTRKAPHNLYTAADKLRAFLTHEKWEGEVSDLPHFTGTGQPMTGTPANTVDINFGGAVCYGLRMSYDPQRNDYPRYMDGKLHTDRETGQPIAARNIIIQRVEAEQFPTSKLHTYDVRVIGSGDGLFISGGKQMPLHWKKDSMLSITQYTDQAGNPLPFQPGQTWVEIVPITGSVLIDAPTPARAAAKLDHAKHKKYNTPRPPTPAPAPDPPAPAPPAPETPAPVAQ